MIYLAILGAVGAWWGRPERPSERIEPAWCGWQDCHPSYYGLEAPWDWQVDGECTATVPPAFVVVKA